VTEASIVTAVIGAGPAGLLFSILSKILSSKQAVGSDTWRLHLFDKRDVYERTHRLRVEPAPFLEIQRELASDRFDEVIDFLSPKRNAVASKSIS